MDSDKHTNNNIWKPNEKIAGSQTKARNESTPQIKREQSETRKSKPPYRKYGRPLTADPDPQWNRKDLLAEDKYEELLFLCSVIR